MSMHLKPITPNEEAGLRAHGLPVGKPSQLADAFRLGMAWAPSQDQIPFGVIDPDYARIYSQVRIIAWLYGYSCCAQGSFTRDLDLLLVPWTDSATLQLDALVSRIADVCGLRIQGEPSSKPHGRKAWSLLLPGFSEVRWVDLSAFPPKINDLPPGESPSNNE